MINMPVNIPRIKQIFPVKTQCSGISLRQNRCDEFVPSFKGAQNCGGNEAIKAQKADETAISPQIKAAIKETAAVSKVLKDKYDKEYGENNWEYVSIGRSCELIACALEMQGVKTRVIPISGLSYYGAGSKGLTEQKGFPKYRQYIYDKGLSPENVNNSGKKFVFQDYRNSGRSMKLFEDFIKSNEFGYDDKNLVFESINDALREKEGELEERGIDADTFIMERLTLDNNMFSYKYFLSSKRLPCEDLGAIQTYETDKPEEKEEEKIFKQGLLKLLKP